MDAALTEAVLEVHATAESLGIKAVLVGALVMEFTAEFREGYPAYKKTNDADFALHVHDWASVERMRAALLDKRYEQDPKIEHRLTKGAVVVDLLPYGEISPDGKLSWPGSGFEMNVVGFPEVCAALASGVRAGLPPIPVIETPGFVILKMFAFQDRHARQDPKHRNDAEHVRYWLDNYATISEDDNRRFDVAKERGWTNLDADAAVLAGKGRDPEAHRVWP